MIPAAIIIQGGALPDAPGVYFFFDAHGTLLYIGKATSLRARVGSYFLKAHNARIAELVRRIARIDYVEVGTVLEALVREANEIRTQQPPFNVMLKDDKSFLYLCITNERFPRPLLVRGLDLERMGIRPFSRTLSVAARKRFSAVYGPYTSGRALKVALTALRPLCPWSLCCPPGEETSAWLVPLLRSQRSWGMRVGRADGKPCFDAQLGKCPGVCTGAISPRTYGVYIRRLQEIFAGKLPQVIARMRRDMVRAARAEHFENAAHLRDHLAALEHIHDVALITRDETDDLPSSPVRVDVLGRIEAFDIAHTGGTGAAASMAVFLGGRPEPALYRHFRIKSSAPGDDIGAMFEALTRRAARAAREPHAWPLPDLFIIDGGEAQVAAAHTALQAAGVNAPLIGIAKGVDRKQDRLVLPSDDPELRRAISTNRDIILRARDEAHRFAGRYHRILRAKSSGIPQSRR